VIYLSRYSVNLIKNTLETHTNVEKNGSIISILSLIMINGHLRKTVSCLRSQGSWGPNGQKFQRQWMEFAQNTW